MTEPKQIELLVTGRGQRRQVSPDPDGTIIGRDAACGVVLDGRLVSRRHARLYRDPFDRWVIEDLDSHNGVWINGRRAPSAVLSSGDRVGIGPYELAMVPPAGPGRRIPADLTLAMTASVVDAAAAERLVTAEADAAQTLSGTWLARLNAITDRLAELTAAEELYAEACRCLGPQGDTAALMVRLGGAAEAQAEILACHFGGREDEEAGQGEARGGDFRLSRRVIQAVWSSGLAVMAGDVRLGGRQLDLTAADVAQPRAVFCAPVTPREADGTIDALYLQVPSGRAHADMLDFVRAAARQIGFAAKSIVHAQEASRRRVLDQQLTMAREIQAGLTPTSPDADAACGLDMALHYQPAMWVGGDYCDVWALASGKVAFAVGDVVGKGLPAALVMTNLHAALRTTVNFCADPAEVMGYVSGHVARHLPEGTFVTLVLGLFEPAAGRLEYVNAGHALPLVVSQRGVEELGRPENPPIGIAEDLSFTAASAVLAAGEGIMVFTDGITESASPGKEMFGTEGLLAAVRQAGVASSREIVDAVVSAAEAFRRPLAQQDDITVFAFMRPETSSD